MNIPKATTAYLLILATLASIPVSIVLTTPTAHAMTSFNSYQEIQDFVHAGTCISPPTAQSDRSGLATSSPGPSSYSAAGAGSSQTGQTTPNHSETNQQVSGVDELDTVKNDGQYIYTTTNNTVAIVQAYPTTNAKLISKVSVNGTLQGIFVTGNRLVIVSEVPGYGPYPYYGITKPVPLSVGTTQLPSVAVYPFQSRELTSVWIFDISDHADPVITTRIDVNGTLAGARLIGNDVYLIASQPVFCYGKILPPEYVLNDQAAVTLPSQVYHSDITDQAYSFTTVIAFDASQSNSSLTSKIYLVGTTSTIYVSLHDIYLTQPVWNKTPDTIIHRISIDNLAINYQATGEVPGDVLNQFSMDEYNGYFRIVTSAWSTPSTEPTPLTYVPISQLSRQVTNLYILDKNLRITGRLEGLSPNEQIYSTRFMGDKAYLVTFKRTDPLMVIGLQDPTKPIVLGQLSITGVSDYLQPYDATHLIGIGMSGTDVAWENAIRFTGLKISLFNVTDANNPVETSRYIVGAPGTSSPATSDHRAVLFDKNLNLLVIPIEITAQPQNSTYWYYQAVWQGAYVFNITADNGIIFRGGITQLPTGELPTWQNNNLAVTRTLYIGNVLYTISNDKVQMNSLTDLTEIGSVTLS